MNRVHFILDEAASLGRLECVDDAVDKYRGYGVRMHFFFQSIGQLKTCFPSDGGTTLLSNTTQVYFGVNDNETADRVSTRLGESTIVVNSGGTSSGSSRQCSPTGSGNNSKTSSYNASSNWQQQTRRLLKPEELMALPSRTAITFTPGVPPICTTLLRYYEEKHLGRGGWLTGALSAFAMLGASVILCIMAMVIAAALTMVVNEKSARQPRAPLDISHRPETYGPR